MYSVAARKGRHRGPALKKYNVLLGRVVACQSHKTPESRLRILRAYRLRLLHEYCQLVLHEVYQDSVTVQTLLACSELRWKSQLFPGANNPFTAGIGACPEHFPLALSEAAKGFQKVGPLGADGQPRPTLDDLISGHPKTVFYIPGSCELVEAVRMAASEAEKTETKAVGFPPAGTCPAPVAAEQIEPDAVDAAVKVMSRPPRLAAKLEQADLGLSREVFFCEAYSYRALDEQLLRYYQSLLQIVALEYGMGRNHAPGAQILTMEAAILSGTPFWE
jgi:hypothetical protein